jgi:hypothetical protein
MDSGDSAAVFWVLWLAAKRFESSSMITNVEKLVSTQPDETLANPRTGS